MRITKNQLRQIIKEELAGVLEGTRPGVIEPLEDEAPGPEVGSAGRGTSKEDNTSVGPPVVKNTPEDSAIAKAVIKNKKEKEKTQIAKEKPPAKVDESRRRKVRKTRRK
tara:strand:+ start:249 stop:575 length:327 start_codon:yes stop_codon:yes gene_type:complete